VIVGGLTAPLDAGEQAARAAGLSISAQPTVLYVRYGDELRQVVRFSVSVPVKGAGGNAPIARGTIEGGDFTYVDAHHPFEEAGEVKVWEVFCVRPGKIQFRVYRREQDALTLIGQVAPEEMKVGLNRFSLKEPIAVRHGDYVGFHISSSDTAIAADEGGEIRFLEGRRNEKSIPLGEWEVEPRIASVRAHGGGQSDPRMALENALEKAVEAADLHVSSRLENRSVRLAALPKVDGWYALDVAEVKAPTDVTIALKSGENAAQTTVRVEPGRHWEVCLVPISHHDLGYTGTIENVLRQYDRFYDDVLRFCDETNDWPEEAKFRYTVEGTWSIQHFVENRPKEAVEKLAKYVRDGRIEIPAFFGNEITGLCSHEEQIRMMYPSFRLRRQFGAPIRTASITDIPGLSWGLPTMMAGAGVKYFFAGLPDYFQWGGPPKPVHSFWDEAAVLRHGRPDAFRWEGPDGKSVLVYYSGSYGFWPGRRWTPSTCEDVLNDLPGALSRMEKADSPFSVVRYGTSGCCDNTPPEICLSHVVREWNAAWAYPKLIVATNSMFFEKLEKQCQDVRTFRGELPHTDYVVGATSTAEETAVNRLTHDRLHAAEKFATIASLLADTSYPAESIRNAYDDMLLYDEHTWGMAHQVGKTQDWNWADKSRYAYRAAGLTEAVLQSGLRHIADRTSREEELEDVSGRPGGQARNRCQRPGGRPEQPGKQPVQGGVGPADRRGREHPRQGTLARDGRPGGPAQTQSTCREIGPDGRS